MIKKGCNWSHTNTQDHILHAQFYLNRSNINVSFTMANSNSFLSPYEKKGKGKVQGVPQSQAVSLSQTKPNKRKSNKRTKSTKISYLFPKQSNRNAKRTEKHKNKITQGNSSDSSKQHIYGIFIIFYHEVICCMYSLESPHQGDSNEYTQHTIIV